MGMTFTTVNLFGYIPVISDWLIMTRKGFIKAGDKYFRRNVEIPSCLEDDLLCKLFRVFLKDSLSISSKWKDVRMS